MSTEALSATIREAAGARRKLRISGSGCWMNAGRPTNTHQTVSLSGDKGIVDYVPDDLTITVRAGTTLDEIDSATRPNDQWLPLDPPGPGAGSIGATIATASSGALAHSFGFARDFILGVEFVTGKGDIVRSGGRVVKNVAGFDLMRLVCGSWGTLGAITQTSLRLYALPKVDRTFALPVPPGQHALSALAESLRKAPLAALSMELVSGSLAKKLGISAADTVLIRLGGNPTLVEAQLKALAGISAADEISTDIWTKLREVDDAAANIALRLSGLPTGIGALWGAARALVPPAEDGHIHATFSRGIVRVTTRARHPEGDLPKPGAEQKVAFEVLPAELWQRASPSVISDRLSTSVQRAYDPHCVLNPGILG